MPAKGFTHESTHNESQEILLTKGLRALVDASDYAEVSKYRWHAFKGGKYAAAHIGRKGNDGKRKQITMHRFILGFAEDDRR